MYGSAADLWTLALDGAPIDPAELAAAVQRQATSGDLDFRTRLLIRDATAALAAVWGQSGFEQWLDHCDQGNRIRAVVREDLGREGFPSIRRRLMDQLKSETAVQFIRELGTGIEQPASISIGDSMALILRGLLSRRTEDIDVADELPPPLRAEHRLLDQLAERYDIRLAHFQSHYLPEGWESRMKSLGRFGKLAVFLVDEYDIAAGKLCSAREKDRDDVRVLARALDKALLSDRLKRAGGKLLAEPGNRENAEKNWYITYGEPLGAA